KRRRKKQGRPDLVTRRKWAESNRERLRIQDAKYRENNRDKMRLTEQRRRARVRNLHDTLTEEELKETLVFFDNKCSLCEEDEFELDHFIPISTNEGGTTVGNIIPLCRRMNRSEEHTSELQSRFDLVCRLLLEKKKEHIKTHNTIKTSMPYSA